ncbi:hypothetical protein SETIT_7G072200v2 [Setaria italica]|uniref:Uncharacterized protein n=1 Tax=Setaria italica TaxID=4555 RepID=K3YFP2_SETIT|nr:uncharacterized protein LOC101763177 [Setaria italica]RCV33289.1 hypothetical protein SETIT_7G072200v2 [Setaria italica]
MVGPIVLAASAGLGMLAGLATADRCSSSSGGARGLSCVACGGTGKVACLCARWSDGDDVGCRPCAGTGRTPSRRCRGPGRTGRRHEPVRVVVRAQRPLEAVTKARK